MTTRSIIGKLQEDGSVKAIYCHLDGYPSGVGETLYQYYDTELLVEELLALGDISALGKTVDSTIAYHRDRGEPINIRKYHSIKASNKEEYLYIWKDSEWTTFSNSF